MLISELIYKLQNVQQEYGDIEVKNVNHIYYNYDWFEKWINLK
jgi:hypothetical protein